MAAAKKVKIKIEKAPRGEENFLLVGVNGKIDKIMRGVEVEVDPAVAEVIRHHYEALDEADAFIEKTATEL